MTILIIAAFAAILGIAYAVFNFAKVKRMSEGTKEMSEIADAIRIGANTFLLNEYKVLAIVVVILAIIFGVFLSVSSAVAFCIGIIMSGAAGFVGMRMATYANVRVSNKARETLHIGKTLKVALRGGSVMGLCVSAFALVGLLIVYALFHGQITELNTVPNWIGIEFVPFAMTLSSYALGCSIIALFNRVGGGIYTKAADMGADLVGKTEMNLPEDDPRNPAVIADCVGDNVGDTAGLGSDLLESYMGSIVSAMILCMHLYISNQAKGIEFSQSLFDKLFLFPVLFVSIGLISCIIGLIFVLASKGGKDPHKELNLATWISAGLTGVINMVVSYFWLNGENFSGMSFTIGWMSPCIAAIIGIVSGVLIGMVAEYYTSYKFNPTKDIAKSSEEGPAITITQGLSVGMKSTLLSVFILAVALLAASFICGTYGVAMAAVGMLSFVTVTVSVDTYGPISDNAGGIAEMSNLGKEVREITDSLDAVGNTTAAIGKGFAIGSATFATVSLMISYLYTFTPITESVGLDLMNPLTLAGMLIGGSVTYYFSGLLINAVGKSARKMVDEVRRQFHEITGLKEGKAKPDYKKCIEISTQGALAEMKVPSIIAIAVPVAGGFIMGPEFVGGILIGATAAAILLAIFCGNSGGAWDNSKKYIESTGEKGSPAHSAAVVGDTVGDPLKDTVGPSLDILIKIMSTISLIMGAIFSQYHLF